MNKRITLISYMDKNEISKIDNLVNNINIKMCKVPYGINDEMRYEIDNLPYHFTIFATNKENQEQIIELAQNINMEKIKVEIKDIEIMNGVYNSFVLYLSIKENNGMKKIQNMFYNKFPEKNYNPKNFTFHINIHIDKNYNKILELKKAMKIKFKPFFIQIDKLALFDYPREMIDEFNIVNQKNK